MPGRATLKWKSRVFLTRLGLWNRVESARLLARLALRRPHEADFAFFRRFDGQDGLFVDIGANIGQSAVSFRIFNRSFRILSLEPNPALAPALATLKTLLGRSFEYRSLGVGDAAERKTIYVPVVEGVPLSQEATFLKEALFEDELTRARVAETTGRGRFGIRELALEIVRLDDLGVRPSAIKLDVQGFELRALRGMSETLARSRPVVMVENGKGQGEIAAFLAGLRYEGPFAYEASTDELVRVDAHRPSLNLFYLPDRPAQA